MYAPLCCTRSTLPSLIDEWSIEDFVSTVELQHYNHRAIRIFFEVGYCEVTGLHAEILTEIQRVWPRQLGSTAYQCHILPAC